MAFQGVRTTADFVTDQAPESWLDGLRLIFPSGDRGRKALLTLMFSDLKKKPIKSYAHHWFSKTLPTPGRTVTDVYIDSALATAYVYATHAATHGIANATVYCKMAEADSTNFVKGSMVKLVDTDQPTVDVVARVTSVYPNGASSYIACQLWEADDNGGATYNLATVDRALKIGSAYAEFSDRPTATAQDASESYNYMHTLRNSMDLSDDAIIEELRTGPAYKEQKRECLEQHSVDTELALLWSLRRATTDPVTNRRLTTCYGIIRYVQDTITRTEKDYVTSTVYDGDTWETGGEKWWNTRMESIFSYGSTERVAFCGAGALTGLERCASLGGHINLLPGSEVYGLHVRTWETTHGTVHLHKHPLFSYDASTQHGVFMFEPDQLTLIHKPGRLMQFRGANVDPDDEDGLDGVQEGFISKLSLEWGDTNGFDYLTGVGQDNP